MVKKTLAPDKAALAAFWLGKGLSYLILDCYDYSKNGREWKGFFEENDKIN